jgi:hypothetical protein
LILTLHSQEQKKDKVVHYTFPSIITYFYLTAYKFLKMEMGKLRECITSSIMMMHDIESRREMGNKQNKQRKATDLEKITKQDSTNFSNE